MANDIAQPAGPVAWHQRWSDLLFLHWHVPSADLIPLVPSGLSVDTFEGRAWVGIVAFRMSRVRPWWFVPVPVLSSLLEINLRTYVHLDGEQPGVVFFSLDASRSLAVHLGRWRWHLPYHRAAISRRIRGQRIRYKSERLWPGKMGVGIDVAAEYGDLLGTLDRSRQPGEAVPGTLEHFLAERYRFYTPHKTGRLMVGEVTHRPYRLHEAEVRTIEQSLLSAAGLPIDRPPDHVLYSPGVDVRILRPRGV